MRLRRLGFPSIPPQLDPPGWAVLLLALLGLSRGAFAQQDYFTADPVWYSGPANGTLTLAVGDVDNDGDLDLVTANDGGFGGMGARLYRNSGDMFERLPVWSSELYTDYNAAALGDVDGDGYPDLVCVGQSRPAAMYRNLGGTFEASPSWESSEEDWTTCMALGDVDGDGDLDLVSGNYDTGNTLHINQNGTFETTARWVSDHVDKETRAIALGDVDGDGDLDLVCGNRGGLQDGRNTMYRNVGGTFETTPAWFSIPQWRTFSIALGDIDGDGDLDLICGNWYWSGIGHPTTLYLNTGTTFEATPTLSWAAWDPTQAVALGDEDGDGDLDLVLGNYDEPNRLYRCVEGMIDTTAVWSTGPSGQTKAVALVDVDGDGELDLINGNISGNNSVHRNVGGPFGAIPAWSSDSIHYTTSVALGDVDADGDLDLVCGNGQSQANALYRNTEGSFETTPSWSSGGLNVTADVALGDLDQNGTLDLVCANYRGPNTIYANVGTTFTHQPVWSSSRSRRTSDVELGDVDGDGHLDLVVANTFQTSALYLNMEGVIDTTAAWEFASEGIHHVALGDVDGDGALDLATGGFRDQLFLNVDGNFEPTPIWSSARREGTSSVALADMDGDGDLDLFVGRGDDPSIVYRNVDGRFEEPPAWSWGSSTFQLVPVDLDDDGDVDVLSSGRTSGFFRNLGPTFEPIPNWQPPVNPNYIALGDLDGDGDLDMVGGNSGAADIVYLNHSRPLLKTDPRDPQHGLPNNGGYLSSVRVEDLDANHRRVHFTAVDVESDPAWVRLEYQHEGAPTWLPAEGEGMSGILGPVSSSPDGVYGSFDWDVSRLPFDGRAVILRARMIEIPRWVSTAQYVASFSVRVGRVTPQRPQLIPSTGELSLETALTVGDTTTAALVLLNGGSQQLTITGIELPSAEMRIDQSTPFDVRPAETSVLWVYFEPRSGDAIAGELLISSNDPLTPVTRIEVGSDIKRLEFSSRLLSPAESIPLGEAATVIITPEPGVRVESGHLFLRPAGEQAAAWRGLPISPSGADFIAVIPGEEVTEGGFDYYVQVENSGVFNTDPPGAPESFFTQAVRAPEGIAANAQPHSGSSYEEGRAINVQVVLPVGTEYVRGALHYRKGGQTQYGVDSLVVGDVFPVASIPAESVGASGVEFWVEVETASTASAPLTDPATNPRASPRQIRVKVDDLQEPRFHRGEAHRMVSLPLTLETDSIENVLSDQEEFGPHDPDAWRLFRYDPGSERYAELSAAPPSGIFQPELGSAFWLVTRAKHRVDTAPIPGLSTPTGGPYPVVLASGWNQVGSPFSFPVAWGSVERPDTVDEPAAFDSSLGDRGRYSADDVAILMPFEGYFIHNSAAQPETLWVPPVAAPESLVARVSPLGTLPPAAAKVEPADVWHLKIVARTDGADDAVTVIGVHPDAREGWDPLDRRQPPAAPGPRTRFVVDHTDRVDRGGAYRRDLRSSSDEGHRWDLVLQSATAGEEITVTGWHEGALPDAVHAQLIDLELGVRLDLRHELEHRLLSGGPGQIHRLVLLAGDEEYVHRHAEPLTELPSRLTLEQNVPNPFNPSTRLRFGLPGPSRVSLVIYNVRGERVMTLIEDEELPAGFHSRIWRGMDHRGERAASGVYLYRLIREGEVVGRKMLLMR